MKKKVSAFALTAILFVSLCVSAGADGNIPSIPGPTDPPLAAATPMPTPAPEQTTQSAQTAEEGFIDWLLGLFIGE